MDILKKYPSFRLLFVAVAVAACLVCCKKESAKPEESILDGEATFYVDESLMPIIEDELAVFQSQYRGRINLVAKPESEVVNALLSDQTKVVIMARKLNDQEMKKFPESRISPKITPFGSDAVAFVTNRTSKDTLVDLQQAINLMQGKPSTLRTLVFENPNSGTVRVMNTLAGTDGKSNHPGVYSMKSAIEVLQYVQKNPGAVGVVGLNIMLQPDPQWQSLVDAVKVMAVRNVKNKKADTNFYKPNQSNLALGLYPLSRELYVLNFSGTAGLGIGFASFVAGETGQRIILKSGLLPVRIPPRIISIRKEINTK